MLQHIYLTDCVWDSGGSVSEVVFANSATSVSFSEFCDLCDFRDLSVWSATLYEFCELREFCVLPAWPLADGGSVARRDAPCSLLIGGRINDGRIGEGHAGSTTTWLRPVGKPGRTTNLPALSTMSLVHIRGSEVIVNLCQPIAAPERNFERGALTRS